MCEVHGLALYAFGDVIVLGTALLEVKQEAGESGYDDQYYCKHYEQRCLYALFPLLFLPARFAGGFFACRALRSFLVCKYSFSFPYGGIGFHSSTILSLFRHSTKCELAGANK